MGKDMMKFQKIFANFSLKLKLLLIMLTLFVILVVTTFYAVMYAKDVSVYSDKNLKNAYIVLKYDLELSDKMKNVANYIQDAFSFSDEDLFKQAEEVQKEITLLLSKLEEVSGSEKEVIELEKLIVDYFKSARDIMNTLNETGDFSGVQKEFIAFSGLNNKIVTILNTYKIEKEKEFKNSIGILDEKVKNIRDTILLSTVIMIVLGVFIGYLFASMLEKQMRKMIDALQDIAEGEGDLTRRLQVVSKDEMGQMAKWLNTFLAKLNNTLSKVAGASKHVSASSIELSKTAKSMADIVSRQTEQSSAVAKSMDEMSATVADVAKSSTIAADTAREAVETAVRGGEVVGKTIEGMKNVYEKVIESERIINALGKSSNEIGEIIQVIEDIADQTNLLALNAAIEAARAGEQGRGFAVVADEVRKLSERTTKATKEIDNMIKRIQHDTSLAVKSMGEGTREVSAGVELANKAEESLRQIVEMVNRNTEMVQRIAAAAEEQSVATEEIIKNIETVTALSGDTASASEETMVSSQNLSALAGKLENIVNSFRLDENSTFLDDEEGAERFMKKVI